MGKQAGGQDGSSPPHTRCTSPTSRRSRPAARHGISTSSALSIALVALIAVSSSLLAKPAGAWMGNDLMLEELTKKAEEAAAAKEATREKDWVTKGVMQTWGQVVLLATEGQSWWERINDSVVWQDRIDASLAAAYAILASVAFTQLCRIQLRVPDYGWTLQKVFHLLNLLFNTLRCLVFAFRRQVETLEPRVGEEVLLDLPGLLFFTTYTLLVLFWAEIYYQVRNLPFANLRPAFFLVNAVVYMVQIGFWLWLALADEPILDTISFASKLFFAVVSVIGALGFLVYGGRLFLMLRGFPIESKNRRKKLLEVGLVTGICVSCFIARAVLIALSAFDGRVTIDVMNHPLLNLIYYSCCEIVPSILVLYILRKLPSKRMGTVPYQQIQ